MQIAGACERLPPADGVEFPPKPVGLYEILMMQSLSKYVIAAWIMVQPAAALSDPGDDNWQAAVGSAISDELAEARIWHLYVQAQPSAPIGDENWHFEVSKAIATELADSPAWPLSTVYLRDLSANSQNWNLLLLQAKVDLQQGHLKEADEVIGRAVAQYPDNPRILIMAGNIASDNDDATRAIGYYKKAAAIQPKNSAIYLGLGRIYMSQSDWPNAISNYEKYLEFGEATSEVLVRLAMAYENAGELQKAEACLVRNLGVHPNRVIALMPLERFYMRQNMAEKAAETARERQKYQKQSDGDPRNLRALAPSSK